MDMLKIMLTLLIVLGLGLAALGTYTVVNWIVLMLRMYFAEKTKSEEWTTNMVESICVQDAPNIDEPNKHGLAPLHVALHNNCPEGARKLIERGASVNCATTLRRNTPLHYAVSSGSSLQIDWTFRGWSLIGRSTEFTEFLLSRGADSNRKNRWGNCPLHVVASGDGTECDARMVRLLFEGGAHVDVRDNRGFTPLALAIYCSNEACIEKLLLCGANINDKSVMNRRFSDIAPFIEYKTSTALMKHWVKLGAAGLPCPKSWKFDEDIESLHRECLVEVDSLKSTLINERTSVYQFLHLGPNDRCVYLNNEKLKNLLCSPDQFPNCVALIMASYNEAIERNSLLDPARKAWLGITKIYLPDLCTERIFNYLSNGDLLDLIENYKNCSGTSNSDKTDMSFGARLAYRLFRYY